MAIHITVDDLPDLARGAAFLGTGGGGNPYVGQLMVKLAMIETGRALVLMDLVDVPDVARADATTMPLPYLVGAFPQYMLALPSWQWE